MNTNLICQSEEGFEEKSGNYDPSKSVSYKVPETVLSHLKQLRKQNLSKTIWL